MITGMTHSWLESRLKFRGGDDVSFHLMLASCPKPFRMLARGLGLCLPTTTLVFWTGEGHRGCQRVGSMDDVEKVARQLQSQL